MGDEDDPRLSLLEKQLEASLERNRLLEKENEQLKQELLHLKSQINSIRAHNSDGKSALWAKQQTSVGTGSINANAWQQKPTGYINNSGETQVVNLPCPRPDSPEFPVTKERRPRVPKPPPRPTSATPPLSQVNGSKAPPPPPPPPRRPSKLLGGSTTKAVRRVPEVMEFYRSLTRRDSRMDHRTNLPGTPGAANSREMIGEIENRSTYLLAIKSDVETQGEFIGFLTKEVENAAFTEISDVEAFVKWLDEELSYLVDERAVLKHFPRWPERKADALREAAFCYRDLKNLESEIWSSQDNHKQAITLTLKRIQALQDRLERSVHNTEKIRESASKRFREFKIPWEWMLDTGMIGQLKLSSMKLAKEYMKRVINELQTSECPQEEIFMLQAVRFAFRVHQFAGGYDTETMLAFEELRKLGGDFQNQQHIDGIPHTC